MVQTKLRVSQPGDADEQEADRAAEQGSHGTVGVDFLHRDLGL